MKTIKQRRHAWLGAACALGLILAPVAGSVLVVGITNDQRPSVVTTQLSVPPSTAQLSVPPTPAPPAPSPATPHTRRARPRR